MPRHADFEKIYNAFVKRYGLLEGEKNYYSWLSKMGLDETKAYASPQESFKWAKNLFTYLREDATKEYFKVEASFPLSSMNNNVYTEDELLRGARSIVGKTSNLNHTPLKLDTVSIEGAEFEDGAVEVIIGVLKGSDVLGMIKRGEIVHVSTEADCLQGTEPSADGMVCKGLVYTGLALLTKDVLPGVPLTRIMPVESIVESFQVMVNGGEKKLSENDKAKTVEGKEETPAVSSETKATSAQMPPETGQVSAQTGEKVAERKSPCEEAKESLLARLAAVEGRVQAIEADKAAEAKARKDLEEKAAADKKASEALAAKPKPAVLTEKGFWARFHEFRGQGLSKSEAFKLVSLEVVEALRSKA